MLNNNEGVLVEQGHHVLFVDGSQYGLPKGWVVELRTRTNPKYEGKVEKVKFSILVLG